MFWAEVLLGYTCLFQCLVRLELLVLTLYNRLMTNHDKNKMDTILNLFGHQVKKKEKFQRIDWGIFWKMWNVTLKKSVKNLHIKHLSCHHNSYPGIADNHHKMINTHIGTMEFGRQVNEAEVLDWEEYT